MTQSYTGGCACGAIRYAISGEPIVGVDCQCRDCQRESGTGHSSHMIFARADVTITGEATQFGRIADSGNLKTSAFCPVCGAPVYMTFAAMPDIVAIRPASLDDPSRYWPQMVTYTMRGHAWDARDPALPGFECLPPS